MRRLNSLLRLVGVNLAVFAVLAEIAAVAYHYVERHEFFYTRASSSAPEAPAAELTAFRIAPYFAFMRAPGTRVADAVEPERMRRMAAPAADAAWAGVRANNYGFLSPVDYPHAPSGARPFVIGVFGGSVAQWFVLQGAPALADALRKHPGWQDRDFVVLNFAAGGYKQPQQLLVLTYMLAIGQRIDYAINIDGFNEIALAGLNLEEGIAAAMPSVQHIGPLARLAGTVGASGHHELVGEIAALKRQAAQIRATQRSRSLAALHAVDSFRLRALDRRLETLTRELASQPVGDPLLALAPAGKGSPGQPGDNSAATVRLWFDSARLMHESLRARQTPFLEVVQPNQYHGARIFSAEEAKIAHSSGSGYRRQVEAGYPALIRALPALRAEGVSVLDATGIFDALPGIVYADDCCHYNQRGNDLLAQAIARAMTGAAVPATRSQLQSLQ